VFENGFLNPGVANFDYERTMHTTNAKNSMLGFDHVEYKAFSQKLFLQALYNHRNHYQEDICKEKDYLLTIKRVICEYLFILYRG